GRGQAGDGLAVAEVVGRQGNVGAAVQVAAERVARDHVHDDVVLGPAEPARLDVETNMPAVAGKGPADVAAVIDLQRRTDDEREVDMAPGLRDVPRRGQVRGLRLGRVAAEYSGGRRARGAGHRRGAVADAAERTGQARASR